MNGERAPLHEALKLARDICHEPFDPPLTRKEIFSIYRQCRSPSGNVFIRITFGVDSETLNDWIRRVCDRGSVTGD